jgi:beta-glucanase (GH16 family)
MPNRNKYTFYQFILSFFLFLQAGYGQVDVIYNDLVWSDEFETSGPVGSSKWFHQTQLPSGGSWYNGELQHYTNRQANSFVDGGNLQIVAKRETFTDQNETKQFTSARLNSKFAFKYGRVDIRAKAPNGHGTWPALWLMGKNLKEDGAFFDSQFGTATWPACGEVDIMEHGIFPDKPSNFIGSAIHTPSSSGNTINKGGIQAGDIEQNYHVYSMNWSPFQISFLLDGVLYYTYNPAVKNASTWPFDQEQFLLFNIAMGGFAGTVPANFTQTSMVIDYVRVYQNVVADILPPTNFTASIGAVTGSTVELLLNATDNSGTVFYNVSNGGSITSATGLSNAPKSVVISGLSPATNYSFVVSASDASGNTFSSNPVTLSATTISSFICSGIDSIATVGSFSEGYKYKFETIGTDVEITFEMLDDLPGLVAYLWKQNPFSEVQMTNVSGRIFAKTITGQTLGSTIEYAVKFAYAGGGIATTRYIPYVVGSNCLVGLEPNINLVQSFFPNPVEDVLHLQLSGEVNQIVVSDLSGRRLIEEKANSSHKIEMSNFKPGIYFLSVRNSGKTSNFKILKK